MEGTIDERRQTSYGGVRRHGSGRSHVQRQKTFDERHPCVATACFFTLWIVALAVVAAVANPVPIGALSGAALRFALEVEALVTVVVAMAVCALLLGRRRRANRSGGQGGGRQPVRVHASHASSVQRGEGEAYAAVDAKSSGLDVARFVGPVQSAFAVAAHFCIGMVAGAVLAAASLGVLVAIGVLRVGDLTQVESLAVWVAACLINAAFQELLIHGYAFTVLFRAKGLAIAMAVTTAVFVVLHPGAFSCGPVAVAVVAGFGILLVLVRVETAGLAGATGLHAAWNALGGVGFGVVALADDYPHVFDVVLRGSGLITGGAMGLEGSVVTLALVVIVIGALLAKRMCSQSNREG